jgi:hypothetical protein
MNEVCMTAKSYWTTLLRDSGKCAIPVPFDPKRVFGKARASKPKRDVRRPTRANRSSKVGVLLIALLSASPASAEPLRVLFIGNSLTAWNDLPALFQALAAAGGHERPITRSIVRDGFSLEDHWNDGQAQKVIADGRWNHVVLQQGPSALPQSRTLLVAYARRFGDLIRSAGAKPALYMVWPSTSRSFDFADVSASYQAAARAVNGTLLPVGDAWRKVLREHRDIKLYADDGLHPTRAGSYVAALVIYRELYQPTTLALPTLGVAEADAVRLQAAVR